MLHIIEQLTTPLAVTSTELGSNLGGDIWVLFLYAGPMVKGVILLLLALSVICWGISLFKFLMLRSALNESETFLDIFWNNQSLSRTYTDAKPLEHSPLAEIFRSGYLELQQMQQKSGGPSGQPKTADSASDSPLGLYGIGAIKRALDQAATAELTRLEKNLGFLATTGSIAPFIGLFGTVWGIMNSFRDIGRQGSANLATVAPGIAEALIATAFGLLAAIPAVVLYNYFLGRIKMMTAEMDNFASELLNIIERYLESRKKAG
ncbi:MAG: protein TolQ [Deltaproteobacteria bacterium]|nr:protein TolQ [Deltaproteobacteria bacterium]